MKGNRLWVLGTVAAIAVIAVVGWFLGISPKLAEADTAALELASVDALNAVQAAELSALRGQDEKIDDLRAELDDLRAAIPTSVEADAFLDSIAGAAAATGTTIARVSFAEPAPWGIAVAEGAPAPTAPTGVEAPPVPTAPDGVYTVAVTIDVVGLSAQVSEFVRLLQNGSRLFSVPYVTYDIEKPLGSVTGFLYVIPAPDSEQDADEGDAGEEEEPTPTDTATPTPEPTETSSP